MANTKTSTPLFTITVHEAELLRRYLWLSHDIGKMELTDTCSNGRETLRVIKSLWENSGLEINEYWFEFESYVLGEQSAITLSGKLARRRAMDFITGNTEKPLSDEIFSN